MAGTDPPSDKENDFRLRDRIFLSTSELAPSRAEANRGAFDLDLILTGPQAELARLARPRRATARKGQPPSSPNSPQLPE
jgi:hypothetical protein